MFRRIRLLFQGILIHYYYTLRRHVRVLVHSSLLRADLRITTLVCRIFSRFGLIDQTRRSRWLITSLLLMVTHLAIWHLGYRARLHTLICRHYVLKIHHIMFHVCLRLRLIDNTRIVFSLFWNVSVTYTKITNIFGWTRLETFNRTLKRFTSLLNSGFTIGFHQRR